MHSHTPAPWEIVPGDEWTTDVGTVEADFDDGRKRHWNVASVNKNRDEWEANRRLIAAAPELLEAADNALSVLIGCCIPRGGIDDGPAILDAQRQLRAAVAKAFGETP